MEDSLRLSERQLAEAQRLAHVGSWSWDFQNGELKWSEELYRIIGADPNEFIPSYEAFIAEYVHPEDRDLVKEVVNRTISNQESFNFHYRIRKLNGEIRIINARGNFIFDEQGKLNRMIGTVQDVTERKLAEEQLQHQLVFTEAITSSLGEGVFSLNEQGQVTYMNPAAEEALGWTQDTLLGQKLHEIIHFQHADGTLMPASDCPVMAVLRSGYVTKVESDFFTRRDETMLPVSYTSSPIITEGQVVGAVIAFHDITERKRVEEMLQNFSQRLIETQEAERRRVARELHDEIGQALTAIKLNLQAIENPAIILPQLNDSIGIVDRAIQQVRDLSLDLRPTQLDDLGLVAALRWHIDREARRAGLVSEFVADLSETRLPPELETACFRIAQEALTNVLRYACAKHVWVELRRHKGELHLRIRDDGIGFDVSAIQTPGVSDRNLGLHGMQERAFIVGGRLDIKSSTGQGTEVYARFPLSENRQIEVN